MIVAPPKTKILDPKPEISKSLKRKDVPVPTIPFEQFYPKYKSVKDLMATDEWQNIYSNYYEFSPIEQTVRFDETAAEVENYDYDKQMEEWKKCSKSFAYFCIKYATLIHPIHGYIKFIPYSYQRRVVECYGKHRWNILNKFRQGGLTTVSVIWAVWRCLFKSGQKIMVVSKTDREAMAAGEIAKTIVENLPSWLKPEVDKWNEHERQFKTSNSTLWFYTVEAARGKAITVLIIDEAAFIKDMDKHWKALAPTLGTGGSCIAISTVNGMGNWYYETYTKAEKGRNKFNIIDIDYWEHPLYNTPSWIEETRANLGELAWAQEIERSFGGSGNQWINTNIIQELITATEDNIPYRMRWDEFRNKEGEKRITWDAGCFWEWQKPLDGHSYIIGVDAAEGYGEGFDNSVMQVLDMKTLEQVAEFYSHNVPIHEFGKMLYLIAQYYNNALVVVEDMHPGNVVISTLHDVLRYENLFYEESKKPGLKSSKAKRPKFLASLRKRILGKTIKINSYRLAHELETFVNSTRSQRPEALNGKHDDAILALSIALYVLEMPEYDMSNSEVGREAQEIYSSELFKNIREEILNDMAEEELFKELEAKPLDAYADFERQDQYTKQRRRFDSLLREFGW